MTIEHESATTLSTVVTLDHAHKIRLVYFGRNDAAVKFTESKISLDCIDGFGSISGRICAGCSHRGLQEGQVIAFLRAKKLNNFLVPGHAGAIRRPMEGTDYERRVRYTYLP